MTKGDVTVTLELIVPRDKYGKLAVGGAIRWQDKKGWLVRMPDGSSRQGFLVEDLRPVKKVHGTEVERLKATELRPALRRFAERMEKKLKANDHKGGWEKCPENHLIKLLKVEIEEAENESLSRAMPGEFFDRTVRPSTEMVADEWADVANFAMMLADNAIRKLKPPAKGVQ